MISLFLKKWLFFIIMRKRLVCNQHLFKFVGLVLFKILNTLQKHKEFKEFPGSA